MFIALAWLTSSGMSQVDTDASTATRQTGLTPSYTTGGSMMCMWMCPWWDGAERTSDCPSDPVEGAQAVACVCSAYIINPLV